MFVVVRSVFWLTVAYMVIKPGMDLPDANALSQQAMAAGSQVIAAHIDTIECDSLQCAGSKAMAAHALDGIAMQTTPAVAAPIQQISNPAPFPRPRPDRAG